MSKLVIVPTPIGNLEDITLRALRILKEAEIILAEDTRTTGILLKHFGIESKMMSHHKFNEHATLPRTIELIKQHQLVALVSDAGTPSVSDPGFLLVRECTRCDVVVECLPGPTALVPALVNSGFPSDRFCFEGFLPQKKGRHTKFLQLKNEERTMVFYESPFRLMKTLEQVREYWGERSVCVSRELSKFHEENIRGSVSQVIAYYTSNVIKGEIVLVVEGAHVAKVRDEDDDRDLKNAGEY